MNTEFQRTTSRPGNANTDGTAAPGCVVITEVVQEPLDLLVNATVAGRNETPHGNTTLGSVRRGLATHPAVFVSPVGLVIVILIWQWATGAFNIATYILPAPSQIFSSLKNIVQVQTFWMNVEITVEEAIIGFAIAVALAFLLSILIAEVPIVDRAVMPYVVAVQAVPTVALAPVVVISLGYGLTSKVVIAAIIVFFPMLVNSVSGLKSASADRIELLRSLGGSRWQVFRRVKFPSALPFIFAGLDISIVFSVVGAVVGEFVGAKAGLGYQQLQANYQFDIPESFAILLVMAVVGILLHEVVILSRRHFVFWERRG